MQVDPNIFKPYDIRGVVPTQLTADIAEQVGRAFAACLEPQTVVVGRDARLTAKEFHARVVGGLTRAGVDVIDIGQVSTDAFYYACASKDLPGLMVTASHNPAEYNGFKMVRRVPDLLLSHELKPWITEHTYTDADSFGSVTEEDVIDDFLESLLKIVSPKSLRPLKVVVDTSNGTQGPIWERLIEHLPITLVKLFFEPDGTFPNHGNDVIQASNQEALRAAVLREKADLGLIFDPDGDRCLVVDDRGQTVPGDFLTALLAVSMLERHPGSTIVYDVRASDAVPDLVSAAGGTPFAWKIGHAFIKPKMREYDAVFGGEVSGHFYFKDFWFLDCGLLTGLVILQYVSELAGGLSEKLTELENKYFLSGEINSTVEDVSAVLYRLKRTYADADIDELDGVAIRYPDWHFVVRPSANEPLLRMTLEATSQKLMEEKRDEVLGLIRQDA